MTGSAVDTNQDQEKNVAASSPAPVAATAAPEAPLPLKDLLAEGSCLAFAPVTKKSSKTLWACSPDGEIKVCMMCVLSLFRARPPPSSSSFFLVCLVACDPPHTHTHTFTRTHTHIHTRTQVLDARTGALAVNPDTQAPLEMTAVEGTPTCLALSLDAKALAIGMESGKVEYNSVTWTEAASGGIPEFSFEDFLVRCTTPVRDMAFSASSKWVAVASDDLELKLVDMADDDRTVTALRKHDGGVRSVCFDDPEEEYLVSLGMDGYAMVWNLGTKECVFTKKVLEKESKHLPDQPLPKAAWKPDGSLLVLPGSRQPVLVERGTWKVVGGGMTPAAGPMAHTAETVVVAWSPDGQVLATAGADKRVVLWAAPKSAPTLLRATQTYVGGDDEDAAVGPELAVRQMVWTGERKLAVMNRQGAFALQLVPAAAAVVSAAALAAEAASQDGGAATESSPAGAASKKTSGRESLSGDESAKQKQKEKGKAFLDDDASSMGGGDGDDDHEEEEKPPMEDEDEEWDGANNGAADAPLVQAPHMQGPFLPSSSPLDATKRYLVWSLVGNIVSQNIGDHNVIEIEFADASRRPIRFTDHYRFVMGSIAEDGAIFASAALAGAADDMEDVEDEHSTVFFRPFTNYSTKNQWLYTLPKGESALSVAVGTRWAAVATSRQWVRLFTFSGLQEAIVAMPGPIVTMVGKGDMLAVFYHGGSPLVDTSAGAGGSSSTATQALHYQLLDVRRSTVVGTGPLALSPKSLLTWAGFSNLDILHVMDSEGLVSGLVKGFGWHWTPLLETSRLQRNKMDSFWPVGVFNGSLMCTLLKGGDEHPSTNPKPLVSSLPLKLPLVASSGSNDQALLKLEETRLVSKAFMAQKLHQQEVLAAEGLEEPQLEGELLRDQASYDAHLVKMIQQAAAGENGERMLEVAEMLNLQKSLELAIRVADHYSLPQVASRISDLLAARFPPSMDDGYGGGYENEENRAPRRTFGAGGGSARGGRNQAPAVEEEEEQEDAQEGDDDMVGGASETEAASPARPQLSRLRANSSPSKAGRGKSSGASSGAGGGSRNPFAVKKDAAGSSKPVEKRPRGIAESLGSLVGSPSPKKPTLSKTSSFVSEIRSKKKHDRRV